MQHTGHLWRTRSETLGLLRSARSEEFSRLRLRLTPRPTWWTRCGKLRTADSTLFGSGMTAAIPDSEFETMGCARADPPLYAGGQPGLMLAPTGVLPQHHGGAGTAVISATLRRHKQRVKPLLWSMATTTTRVLDSSRLPNLASLPVGRPNRGASSEVLDESATLPAGEVQLPDAYGV